MTFGPHRKSEETCLAYTHADDSFRQLSRHVWCLPALATSLKLNCVMPLVAMEPVSFNQLYIYLFIVSNIYMCKQHNRTLRKKRTTSKSKKLWRKILSKLLSNSGYMKSNRDHLCKTLKRNERLGLLLFLVVSV